MTDPGTLLTELEVIREQGIAYDCDETITGLTSVGAPIIRPEDTVIGTISVIDLTSRLEDKHSLSEIDVLVRKSQNITWSTRIDLTLISHPMLNDPRILAFDDSTARLLQ